MHFLIYALLAFSLTACSLNFGEDYTREQSSFTAEDLMTVESVTKLKLPPGVKGLNMFYQGSGIDDALIAKLKIPEDQVTSLANAIYGLNATEGAASTSLSEGYAWWNEGELKVKVHRSLNLNSEYLELILGQVGGDWILLVKWLST